MKAYHPNNVHASPPKDLMLVPFSPLGASTNGRLENVPLSRDATAMASAVLVVVSLTGRPVFEAYGNHGNHPDLV